MTATLSRDHAGIPVRRGPRRRRVVSLGTRERLLTELCGVDDVAALEVGGAERERQPDLVVDAHQALVGRQLLRLLANLDASGEVTSLSIAAAQRHRDAQPLHAVGLFTGLLQRGCGGVELAG